VAESVLALLDPAGVPKDWDHQRKVNAIVAGTKARSVSEAREQWTWFEERQKGWRDFAQTSGHESLLRQRNCTLMGDWLGWLEPLLVPRLKLAFCGIPKVATTKFKDLINTLNGLNTTLGFGAADYMASMPKELNISMATVTKENGWRSAAFTRDPLQRYLSAWASTCIETDEGEMKHPAECCGMFIRKGASPEFLAERFGQRIGWDAAFGVPFEEQHWVSQVQVLYNCGWELFKPEALDFRGDLSAGGVKAQVEEMLRVVGATEKDLELVDAFFGKGPKGDELRNRVATHREERSPKIIREFAKSFFPDRPRIELLKHIYSADFALLPGVGDHFTAEMLARFP